MSNFDSPPKFSPADETEAKFDQLSSGEKSIGKLIIAIKLFREAGLSIEEELELLLMAAQAFKYEVTLNVLHILLDHPMSPDAVIHAARHFLGLTHKEYDKHFQVYSNRVRLLEEESTK